MIQRQKLLRISLGAVLACKVIANVDVISAKSDGSVVARANIGLQSHDAWQLEARPN